MLCRARWLAFRSIGVFVLPAFLLLFVCCLRTARAATIEDRLARAAVTATFETEGARVRAMAAEGPTVAFEVVKKDSTVILVYDTSGELHSRHCYPSSGEGRVFGLRLSRDGRAVMAIRATTDWLWDHLVFDRKGAQRAMIHAGGVVIPSPRGLRFCTIYNHATHPPLDLFREDGTRITRMRFPVTEWFTGFLDDSTLIVADPDSVWTISAETGDVLAVLSLNLDGPQWLQGLRVHSNGQLVAIFKNSALALVDLQSGVIRRIATDDSIGHVTYSDDGTWLALRMRSLSARQDYVKVVAVDNPTIAINSELIPYAAPYSSADSDLAWFSGGVLTISAPPRTTPCNIDPDGEHWTIFLEFDPEARRLGPSVIIPGLFRPLNDSGGPRRFLRVDPPGVSTLVKLQPERK